MLYARVIGQFNVRVGYLSFETTYSLNESLYLCENKWPTFNVQGFILNRRVSKVTGGYASYFWEDRVFGLWKSDSVRESDTYT
jgi:hypothetical protein